MNERDNLLAEAEKIWEAFSYEEKETIGALLNMGSVRDAIGYAFLLGKLAGLKEAGAVFT